MLFIYHVNFVMRGYDMMIIYRLLSESFIAYGWYIRCYEELEGYVTSRLIVNNRMYILQVSNGDDLKLLSKIIITVNSTLTVSCNPRLTQPAGLICGYLA